MAIGNPHLSQKFINSIVIVLTLSGCSALRENVVVSEPDSGARARIRVVIPLSSAAYRGVRAYPGSRCVSHRLPGNGMVVNMQMILGFEKNLNGRKLGIPETDLSQDKDYVSAEIYAAAEQPISFSYLKPASEIVNGPYSTIYPDGCGLSVSFVPAAGADYELDFEAAAQCVAHAVELRQEGISPQARPIALQVAPACTKRELDDLKGYPSRPKGSLPGN